MLPETHGAHLLLVKNQYLPLTENKHYIPTFL